MSAYSLTAYLPGPRVLHVNNYNIKDRVASAASNHLDDCLRRTDKQSWKLSNLNRTCADNLDACNVFYKNARM